MPLPQFPFTRVDAITSWFNWHHTTNRPVPIFVTPDALATASSSLPPAQRQAQALNAIIDFCFKATPPERLTVLGATWSLSNILEPANVVVDQGALDDMTVVDDAWLTDAYKAVAAPRGGKPIIVQGGTNIGNLNQTIGAAGLAIQTSGANNGHLLAGCIATGTHGSAVNVGAAHDTVLGVFLLTAPNQAVFVQPNARRFTPDLAQWFERTTKVPTQEITDDDVFAATQVALGSLGFVHSVVIEAVPLYELTGSLLAKPLHDAAVWKAMTTLDTSTLDARPNPYHFSVVLSPYASSLQSGAFATLLWKQEPTRPFAGPTPVTAAMATDTSRIVAAFVKAVEGDLTDPLLEHVLALITEQQFKAGRIAPLFPGQMFGPTNLPSGNGRSTEIIVDHGDTERALLAVLSAVQSERKAGRHFLGAIGVRFVPKTSSLLGMNIHDRNTCIELPSLQSPDISRIYTACWQALRNAGIRFTCHWGQEYGMDNASLQVYFGDRITRWQRARARLLATATARSVFATPQLNTVGLG